MSKKYQRFHSGLATLRGEIHQPGPWKGRGWTARLGKESDKHTDMHNTGSMIMIEALNEITAQKGLDLILALHAIYSASPDTIGSELKVVSENLDPQMNELGLRAGYSHICTVGFPMACKMASKASQKMTWVYAASLYQVSQRVHANHPENIEPFMYPQKHRSPHPIDHVRFAYAIVIAYAIVEQLGLEVRASTDKPSTIKGEWNPVVLRCLEQRLNDAGIDKDTTIMWIIRGGKTKIETNRPLRSQGKQEWSCGPIRDCEIKVVDAINYLSMLRSKVASHRIGETVKLLSVYDVANAQHLSRFLILKSIGYGDVIVS